MASGIMNWSIRGELVVSDQSVIVCVLAFVVGHEKFWNSTIEIENGDFGCCIHGW